MSPYWLLEFLVCATESLKHLKFLYLYNHTKKASQHQTCWWSNWPWSTDCPRSLDSWDFTAKKWVCHVNSLKNWNGLSSGQVQLCRVWCKSLKWFWISRRIFTDGLQKNVLLVIIFSLIKRRTISKIIFTDSISETMFNHKNYPVWTKKNLQYFYWIIIMSISTLCRVDFWKYPVQLTFTCSKSTIITLEKGVKYVLS